MTLEEEQDSFGAEAFYRQTTYALGAARADIYIPTKGQARNCSTWEQYRSLTEMSADPPNVCWVQLGKFSQISCITRAGSFYITQQSCASSVTSVILMVTWPPIWTSIQNLRDQRPLLLQELQYSVEFSGQRSI